MISARAQAWVGLVIGGVALVIGLIASRGDDDPADELERYNANEERRRVEARAYAAAVDVDQLPEVEVQVEVTALLVRLDGLEVSNDELEVRARILASANPTTTVALRSATDVPYARVVEILDLLNRAGLKQVTIAAPS